MLTAFRNWLAPKSQHRATLPRTRLGCDRLEDRSVPAAFASASAFSGDASSEVYGMVRDTTGNTYLVGAFGRDPGGTIDLDPTAGTYTLTSQGAWDGFVAKYAADGSILWGRQLGGSGSLFENASAVVVEATGNVHVGGHVSGSADLDPSATYPDDRDLVGVAGVDTGYIASFAPDGSLLRVWQSSGSTRLTKMDDLAIDGGNNLVALGEYLNPPPNNDYVAKAIVKVSAVGQLLWRANYAGTKLGGFVPNALAVDAGGGVHLTGELYKTADLDPTSGTLKLSSKNGASAVVSKLSATGGLVWAKQFTAAQNSNVYGYDVAVDGSRNVFAAGYYKGKGDFDPGSGTLTLTSPTGGGAFVTKLSSAGNLVESQQVLW